MCTITRRTTSGATRSHRTPTGEQLKEAGKRNILGLEAPLWGENGESPKIRKYQAFPKLLGVAERAWNRNTPSPQQMPAARDVFVNTLGQVNLPLLSFYQRGVASHQSP
jgi:hexosaminidase